MSVQEITGVEGDVVAMQKTFSFDRTGTDARGNIDGHFAATGVRPKFARRFEQWGLRLGDDLFNPHRRLG